MPLLFENCVIIFSLIKNTNSFIVPKIYAEHYHMKSLRCSIKSCFAFLNSYASIPLDDITKNYSEISSDISFKKIFFEHELIETMVEIIGNETIKLQMLRTNFIKFKIKQSHNNWL